MDVFTYTAHNNPYGAKAICHKYGYNIVAHSKDDVGTCLQQLVLAEGEPALKDIFDIHPDKDAILHLFAPIGFAGADGTTDREKRCGCGGGCSSNFVGADGSTVPGAQTSVFSMVAQTNTLIIMGALVLGLAIIIKK